MDYAHSLILKASIETRKGEGKGSQVKILKEHVMVDFDIYFIIRSFLCSIKNTYVCILFIFLKHTSNQLVWISKF